MREPAASAAHTTIPECSYLYGTTSRAAEPGFTAVRSACLAHPLLTWQIRWVRAATRR